MLDVIITKKFEFEKIVEMTIPFWCTQLDVVVWKETNMKKFLSVGIKSGWIGEDWNMATDNGNSD